MRILAISGSIRAGSSNGAVLLVAAAQARPDQEVRFAPALDTLPHFNPDLDGEGAVPPPPVAAWRAALAAADGVLLSTPEYAGGMPGVLKNALDWVVSSGELTGKPIVLVHASATGGEKTEASLVDVLGMLSARLLRHASVRIPGVRAQLDAHGQLRDPALLAALRGALDALATAARTTTQ